MIAGPVRIPFKLPFLSKKRSAGTALGLIQAVFRTRKTHFLSLFYGRENATSSIIALLKSPPKCKIPGQKAILNPKKDLTSLFKKSS